MTIIIQLIIHVYNYYIVIIEHADPLKFLLFWFN
jgi:hypothetical protein